MKIWIHPYQLKPVKQLNGVTGSEHRSGTLIKVEWSLGKVGYSDLFPWPEFGDPTLDGLLSDLSAHDFTHPLLKKSLIRNHFDSQSRAAQRSLFQTLMIPTSHALLHSLKDFLPHREMGFKCFKFKASSDVDESIQNIKLLVDHLHEDEFLRIDFNSSIQFEDFIKIANKINLSKIDLIEDPWAPKKAEDLSLISPKLRSKLANDFSHHPFWPHQVIKTARRDFTEVRPLSYRQISTHSMDHPVGQAFALWEAARFERLFPHRKEVHGVSRSNGYESTDFDWAWNGFGPNPTPPKGNGVGFDEVFNSLRWERIDS